MRVLGEKQEVIRTRSDDDDDTSLYTRLGTLQP